MRGKNKYIIWLLFKIFVVLVLCLVGSIWIHREKIVRYVINRELFSLYVYDLNYTVGEISPSCFELRDISWGNLNDPFLYLSFLKISYTPQGLYAGVVNRVALGRLETLVSLDKENKPRFELLERGVLVVERAELKYSSKKTGDGRRGLILPEFLLDRGTLVLRESDGSEMGRANFTGNLSGGRGGLVLKGGVDLPTGENVDLEGEVKLTSLDLSSVAADITASADLSDMLAPELGFESGVVNVTGSVQICGLDSTPEWKLKLQVPQRTCIAENPDFSLSSMFQGECEVGGSITNMSGFGEFFLRDFECVTKKSVDRPEILNCAERIYFDCELSDCSFDELSNAVVSGRIGVCNLRYGADELIEVNKAFLDISFDASIDQGVNLSESSFGWHSCEAGGVALEPGCLEMLVSNNAVNLAASVSLADEPLKVLVDAVIPFADPQGVSVKIEVPPVNIDSSGVFGALVREKSEKDFDFNGTVSASAMVDGLKPEALVTGCLNVVDGSFGNKGVDVAGVNIRVPFEFTDKLRSVDLPLMTIASVNAGNITLSDGKVLFHLHEDELFVESAQIGWAKGYLRIHSVHAGFDGNIRNEFTIYADRVDLGEVFTLVMPFEGQMEGVLYGRFPVALKNKRIKLSSGFLYSLPGQGGVLKLENPADMEGLLERAGISSKLKVPLSHALSDVEFSAIRFDLENGGSDDSVLRIKLDGESKYEEWPAPVDLNINLHGPLEDIVNLGMDLQRFKESL